VAWKDKVLVPSKRLSALDILVVHTQSRGNAHLQRRLYQKVFETFSSLVYFLMDVRLVALI
jgi:hypothetical protein